LHALQEYLAPPAILILRGQPERMADWQRRLNAGFRPHLLTFALDATADGLPPALQREYSDDVNAWLCRGVECLPVIDNPEALLNALSSLRSS
jgi:uncharacterized protein YyaL (SSP411 family)